MGMVVLLCRAELHGLLLIAYYPLSHFCRSLFTSYQWRRLMEIIILFYNLNQYSCLYIFPASFQPRNVLESEPAYDKPPLTMVLKILTPLTLRYYAENLFTELALVLLLYEFYYLVIIICWSIYFWQDE